MYVFTLLLIGAVLGFAHAARSWLAIRMKAGKRCVPKVYLWRGVRNMTISLGIFVSILYVGQASQSTTGTAVAPGEAMFSALLLLAIGFGLGNGLSNVFGGTLSYATEGPVNTTNSRGEGPEGDVTTDEYGQLKQK